MFRKYYKEAMDDIKPREEFVNSVIANAKRKKPPAYRQYMRYAVGAAAAVVVVSAAVISMPRWERIDTDDGIIIEETVTETASPKGAVSTPIPSVTAAPASAKAQTPPPVKAARSLPSAASDSPQRSESTSEHSYDESAAPEEESTEEISGGLESAVEDTAEFEPRAEAVPYEEDNMVSSSGATAPFNAAEAPSAKKARIEDSDIPVPSGYYCTSASANGYTFVNDNGAVIVVTVAYGGEEREPYIEEDGDNIYASFNSFGMSVTINASGADRTAVEEIINSLR